MTTVRAPGHRSTVVPLTRVRPGARAALQVVVVLLTLAVALRDPTVIALASPLLVGLAVDLLARGPTSLQVVVDVPARRLLEGDDVVLRVTVDHEDPGDRPPAWCRVTVRAGASLDGPLLDRPVVVRTGQSVVLPVTARHWGVTGIERVQVDWSSPLGLFASRAVVDPATRPLRVHPPVERLRELVRARRTGAWAGARPAASAGHGIEFAELRPFAPGDLPRDVVWRVTARQREPWVATRHPERSTDVVLLLDAFDPGAVDEVVRTAAMLVDAHLEGRDRVGVLGLSGVLRWVVPGTGDRHRHRVLDLLLRTQVVQSWATRNLGTVPAAALPPGAIVIAITRLGEAMARAVADLRARGRDVLVVDLTAPAADVDPPADDPVERAARLLADLMAADARDRLRRLGATVVVAGGDVGLARALSAAASRRRARTAAR